MEINHELREPITNVILFIQATAETEGVDYRHFIDGIRDMEIALFKLLSKGKNHKPYTREECYDVWVSIRGDDCEKY